MPELPEVHTTATILDKLIVGLRISDVWTNYNSTFHHGKDSIKDPKYFSEFKAAICSTTIASVSRRAKNVLLHLSSGDTILVHMKMTGHLLYGTYSPTSSNHSIVWRATEPGPLQDPFNQYIRFVISFSNGSHLALSDMRKFAKVTLIQKQAHETVEDSPHLAGTGPEPLDPSFTPSDLEKRLARFPNGFVKLVLMNPEVVAGIGNIYSDEMLWTVGMHPETRISAIPKPYYAKLHAAAVELLSKGISFGGDSMSDYRNPYGLPGEFQLHHHAYRRTGKPCEKPNCKGTIVRKAMGGRGAHYCDIHQKLFSAEASNPAPKVKKQLRKKQLKR